MFEATAKQSGDAAADLPPWLRRVSAGLNGNAGHVHKPAFEWLRRAGYLSSGELLPAAVLVPIIEQGGGPTLLFTRRRDDLMHHPGQVAFPGGSAEPEDCDPEATALREAEEEVGLPPERVHILGRLPCYPTTSGYLVTPVVGHVADHAKFIMQKEEVSEIFAVPFAVLLDESAWQERPLGLGETSIRLPELNWQGHRIWGATAGMLRLLLPALRDAWRGES